jgi:hypothetical protein
MAVARDKSPDYILVVPPGHTRTDTALNAEMSKIQGKAGYAFSVVFDLNRPEACT